MIATMDPRPDEASQHAVDTSGPDSIMRLRDGTLAHVLRALPAGHLASLASCCSRACNLARSLTPCVVHVDDEWSINTFINLQGGLLARTPLIRCFKLFVSAAPEHVPQVPRVLAAAANMVHLRSLDLVLQPVADDDDMKGADSIVAGLLLPLTGLQQLRELELTTCGLGAASAANLGSLTQLTSLKLVQCHEVREGLDLSQLSGLTRLVELVVELIPETWVVPGTPAPPASAAGPFCLPSSLQRLKLCAVNNTCLQHLPGCPQLVALELWYGSTHPSDVLELAARHTPGLQQLTMTASEAYPRRDLPCEALQVLTNLQHLDLRGGSMYMEHAADWWALAGLKGLTTLKRMTLLTLPPQGWQHNGVKQLDACLQLANPQEAVRVLTALPALEWASLGVSLQGPMLPATPEAAAARTSAPEAPACPHLTTLGLTCEDNIPLSCAAPLIAAASSSLVTLAIDGKIVPGDPTTSLPDLRACTALQTLVIGHSEVAGVEDAVSMVQPLALSLQTLSLRGWVRTSPAAAEVLQHVLPHLVTIEFQQCRTLVEEDPTGGSEEEQLQRLKQALRPGLLLKVNNPPVVDDEEDGEVGGEVGGDVGGEVDGGAGDNPEGAQL